jgi:hypothetical protein
MQFALKNELADDREDCVLGRRIDLADTTDEVPLVLRAELEDESDRLDR